MSTLKNSLKELFPKALYIGEKGMMVKVRAVTNLIAQKKYYYSDPTTVRVNKRIFADKESFFEKIQLDGSQIANFVSVDHVPVILEEFAKTSKANDLMTAIDNGEICLNSSYIDTFLKILPNYIAALIENFGNPYYIMYSFGDTFNKDVLSTCSEVPGYAVSKVSDQLSSEDVRNFILSVVYLYLKFKENKKGEVEPEQKDVGEALAEKVQNTTSSYQVDTSDGYLEDGKAYEIKFLESDNVQTVNSKPGHLQGTVSVLGNVISSVELESILEEYSDLQKYMELSLSGNLPNSDILPTYKKLSSIREKLFMLLVETNNV